MKKCTLAGAAPAPLSRAPAFFGAPLIFPPFFRRLNTTTPATPQTPSHNNSANNNTKRRYSMMAANSGSLPIVAESPSQARSQRAVSGRTDDSSPNSNEDLSQIHRQALQFLRQRTTLDSRNNELLSLQRKRIRLVCTLEEAKQKASSGRTVGNELRE